jgi:crotonobetainyl-CoA:carnitine CoA-transferase CaiB-like acyl-CoA transferase
MMVTRMNDSLSGLRVIDFTQVAAGPTCTMMLADRGADVIKIEAPTGDLCRQLGPPWINGESVVYLSLNRNKRSVVLDLKQQQNVEVARQLVAQADIVVESFRPGVMERLGLGYQAMRELKPDLLYCSISAYGQTGPSREKPGVDGIIQAVSGLMSITGTASGEPTKVQAPVVDMVTGFMSTIAILDALRMRDRTGQGQWLDISMYASAMQLQQTALASYLASGEVPVPCGSGAPYAAPNEAYPTKDGWIMVAAYHEQRWRAFCRLLDLDSLPQDIRFSSLSSRVQYRDDLFDIVAVPLKQKTTAEWIAEFEQADIICAPVANYADLTRSAQFVRSSPTVRFTHPAAGEVDVIGPMRTSLSADQPVPAIRPPPRLGEHTREVLAEVLAGPAVTKSHASGHGGHRGF